MDVIFSTCDRSPAYIHETLATMLLSGIPEDTKIHLVMDTPYDMLSDYQSDRIFKYCRHKEEGEGLPSKIRAAMNYARCLQLNLNTDVLICEDDNAFVPKLFSQLQFCIKEIELITNDPYILTLSNHKHHEGTIIDFENKPFCEIEQHIDKSVLYCTAWSGAYYYPKCFNRKKLLEFFIPYAIYAPSNGGYDITLGWYFHKNKIRIFQTKPPLAKIIGKISAINYK